MRGHLLRAAPKGTWTPASITTALWLDAADPTTVTLNGSNVAQWNDKSGNARHVIQSTGANQPSYSFQVNGKNVLRFNGSSVLSTSVNTPVSLTNRSAFLVFQELVHVNYFGVLVFAPTTGFDYLTGNAVAYTGGPAGAGWFEIVGSVGYTYSLIFPGAPDDLSPLGIYGEVLSGTTGTMYLNGISRVTDTSFSSFGTSSGKIIIGSRFVNGVEASAYRMNGNLCEIIYCDYAITTDNRQRVEGYLAHKWGLTSGLPAAHPYKSLPP